MKSRSLFLISVILFLMLEGISLSYSSKIAFVPEGGFILIDEGDSLERTYVLTYGGKMEFEYDVANKWNLLFDFGYHLPMLAFGSERIFNKNFFIIDFDVGGRYYPYGSKETSLIESDESTILVEHKKSHINPFITCGIASKFLINNDPKNSTLENMTTLGFLFNAGIDFPIDNRWGFTLLSPFKFLMTMSSPLHLLFVFGMNAGVYFIF